MNLRKLNNVIHRDLGYLCFGLTLVYAISGFFVNHIRHWDSNFIVENKTVVLQNVSTETEVNQEFVDGVLDQLGQKADYKGHARISQGNVQIFINGGTVDVDLEAGKATMEKKKKRPLLRELNFLHLNQGHKLWIWIGDMYAVSLFLLAVTGLFILKGKNGLAGRGKWFVAAGILIPVLFLIVYFY